MASTTGLPDLEALKLKVIIKSVLDFSTNLDMSGEVLLRWLQGHCDISQDVIKALTKYTQGIETPTNGEGKINAAVLYRQGEEIKQIISELKEQILSEKQIIETGMGLLLNLTGLPAEIRRSRNVYYVVDSDGVAISPGYRDLFELCSAHGSGMLRYPVRKAKLNIDVQHRKKREHIYELLRKGESG